MIGKIERTGTGGEIADPPADLGPRGQHRLFLRRAYTRDAPAVEHEIERCTRDPERERESDRPPDPMAGITDGDSGQHGDDGENGYEQPAAPPPEYTSDQWRIILIEKWCPDELELVSEGQFAEQSDRR